jgi:hypothetical protein
MPRYARVWRRRNEFEAIDLGNATPYPADRALAGKYLGRLEAWYEGRLRLASGRQEPSPPTLTCLWHFPRGLNVLEYHYTARSGEGPFYVEIEPSLAVSWWQENGHQAPKTGLPVAKLPTYEEANRLAEVVAEYWGYLQMAPPPLRAFERDELVRDWFVRLADAVHAVRPRVVSVTGWRPRMGVGLKHLVEAFDRIKADWGWERLDEPEPARSQYHAECLDRFSQEVKHPLFQAAISWDETFDGTEPMLDPRRIADEGREQGFTGTIPPDRAESAYRDAEAAYRTTLLFGKKIPVVKPEHSDLLFGSFAEIYAALEYAKEELTCPALEAIKTPVGGAGPHLAPDQSEADGLGAPPTGTESGQPASGSASDPKHLDVAPTKRPGREPNAVELEAYRLHVDSGWKQARVAEYLSKQQGRPFDQGKVSRMVTKVREWKGQKKARESPPPRIEIMDPRRLELGSRQNNARRKS